MQKWIVKIIAGLSFPFLDNELKDLAKQALETQTRLDDLGVKVCQQLLNQFKEGLLIDFMNKAWANVINKLALTFLVPIYEELVIRSKQTSEKWDDELVEKFGEMIDLFEEGTFVEDLMKK